MWKTPLPQVIFAFSLQYFAFIFKSGFSTDMCSRYWGYNSEQSKHIQITLVFKELMFGGEEQKINKYTHKILSISEVSKCDREQ